MQVFSADGVELKAGMTVYFIDSQLSKEVISATQLEFLGPEYLKNNVCVDLDTAYKLVTANEIRDHELQMKYLKDMYDFFVAENKFLSENNS